MKNCIRLRPALLLIVLIAAVFIFMAQRPAPVSSQQKENANLQAGFGEMDISPKIGKAPIYIAGFGHNRKAKGVHDPLKARAVVLKEGERKIAIVSVDVVGLFLDAVERVRKKLPGFDYVLVSATHNHEGPDTMGLWGQNPLHHGVDPAYLAFVEKQIVGAVQQASQNLSAATAKIGTARGPELLHDSRKPIVKHDELTAISLTDAKTGKRVGIVVQWNCHPETLGGRFTEVSADYVGPAVDWLQKKYQCPVVYFTGTVGGLMTSLHVPVHDDKGKPLKDGTWEKTKRYGELVGQLAAKALSKSAAVGLTPLRVKTRALFLPIDNKLYVFAWKIGVLKRQAYYWKGDPNKAEPVKAGANVKAKERLCVKTEVGLLKLGQLQIAAIPGEIYPELVLGKVENPAVVGADFPNASVEPAIYQQMRGPHRMLIGLANDEVGYILPKRQWDATAPYCYGLTKSQYGEINSLGADTGPLLCDAFQQMTRAK